MHYLIWAIFLLLLTNVFVMWPGVALAPAIGFYVLYRKKHRNSAALASFVWFAYGFYEFAMHYRLLCSGECNIRIDLLAIVVVLVIVSARATKETRQVNAEGRDLR